MKSPVHISLDEDVEYAHDHLYAVLEHTLSILGMNYDTGEELGVVIEDGKRHVTILFEDNQQEA